MKKAHALLLILAATLGACGSPDAEKEASELLSQERPFAQNFWCPTGAQPDSNYRLCIKGADALGPFSPGMVSICQKRGGGTTCNGRQWYADFARQIRGTDLCSPGTSFDAERQVCLAENSAYGPFSEEAVRKCRSLGGRKTCDTQVWPKKYTPTSTNAARSFRLPAPTAGDIESSQSLWATYYYLPSIDPIFNGFPLRDINGNSLGVTLGHQDWCAAAMEGSVFIRSGQQAGRTYNYGGKSTINRMDCSSYYPTIDVGNAKFRLAVGPYGDGIQDYILSPYRTIAVDPTVIPYGTVVYIPTARGTRLTLPNGSSVTHDGYFFAGDTGGAIKGNHIDVFIGTSKQNPFPWISSNSGGSFSVRIIGNAQVKSLLEAVHHAP